MARRKGGCLFTFLGILIILVIAVVVLLHMTPNTLGFGDVELPLINASLDEMGLGDTKIIDVFKAVGTMTKDSDKLEEKIVEKPVEEDTSTVDEYYEEDIDYSNLFESEITPTVAEPFTLTDAQLGAILNAASAGLAVKMGLPQGGISVKQFLLKTEGSGVVAKVVLAANTDELLAAAGLSSIKDQLKSIGFTLGSEMFFSVTIPLAEAEGVIETGGQAEVVINGNPTLTSILSGLLSSSSFNLNDLADEAANLVCTALNNLAGSGSVTLGDGFITVYP